MRTRSGSRAESTFLPSTITMTAKELIMKTEVAKAVAEVRDHFAPLRVDVFESSCGGAYVLIHDVPLGPPYTQSTTWVGFFITNACPYADTYPFYVQPNLS